MATFNHQCKDCGHLFESIRPMSESDKKPRCPNCKSRNTRKLIHPTTALFNGDGFTKTSNN